MESEDHFIAWTKSEARKAHAGAGNRGHLLGHPEFEGLKPWTEPPWVDFHRSLLAAGWDELVVVREGGVRDAAIHRVRGCGGLSVRLLGLVDRRGLTPSR